MEASADESRSPEVSEEEEDSIDPLVLRTLSPAEIIERAARAPPSSAWVRHVADQVGEDPRYRRFGSTQMFLRHIINGQWVPGRPPGEHWYFLAAGVCNTFKAIYTEETEVEDAKILDELHAAYWRLLDVVLGDLGFLESSEQPITLSESQEVRAMLIGIIFHCSSDPNMQRYAPHCRKL